MSNKKDTSNHRTSFLAAVDGSGQADVAFECAKALCKGLNAKLYVLTVVEPTHLYPSSNVMHVSSASDVEQKHRDLLAAYVRRAESDGVDCFPLIATAKKAGPTICKIAHFYDVDCIVSGRTGATWLKKLTTGSTSNYLLKHAPCSLYLAHNFLTSEVHDSIHETQCAEQVARCERIAACEAEVEHSDLDKVHKEEEKERRRRVHDCRTVQLHDSLDAVIQAEEEERVRRMQLDDDSAKSAWNRALNKNISIMAEDDERRRRVRELQEAEEEEERARQEDLKKVIGLEEVARAEAMEQLGHRLAHFVNETSLQPSPQPSPR